MRPRAAPHIFGPVFSRRLGLSLGVDLVPFKTCNFDCLYCQLGPTTLKTMVRREWVPTEEVLRQLRERLETCRPDWVTISGSGEPTLHSHLGEIIAAVKEMTDVPVAVLTNGSLLGSRRVAEALRQADLVMPSLDAPNEELFHLVNRPTAAIGFLHMLLGLAEFRARFRGQLWLEVMLIADVTGSATEVTRLARLVKPIAADRVQLNTPVRPPARTYVEPVPLERLRELAALFEPPAEVIGDPGSARPCKVADEREGASEERGSLSARLLAIVARRPSTVQELAIVLQAGVDVTGKEVAQLVARGTASYVQRNARLFVTVGQEVHESEGA